MRARRFRPTLDALPDRVAPADAAARARLRALADALDEVEQIADEADSDEAWAEALHNIDAARPHRELFAAPGPAPRPPDHPGPARAILEALAGAR